MPPPTIVCFALQTTTNTYTYKQTHRAFTRTDVRKQERDRRGQTVSSGAVTPAVIRMENFDERIGGGRRNISEGRTTVDLSELADDGSHEGERRDNAANITTETSADEWFYGWRSVEFQPVVRCFSPRGFSRGSVYFPQHSAARKHPNPRVGTNFRGKSNAKFIFVDNLRLGDLAFTLK